MPGINMQILLKSEYDDTLLTKAYLGRKPPLAVSLHGMKHPRRMNLNMGDIEVPSYC